MSEGRELDERLAWLIHVEYEGDGHDSINAETEDWSRDKLREVLALAVVEIMETKADAERQVKRLRRRANRES